MVLYKGLGLEAEAAVEQHEGRLLHFVLNLLVQPGPEKLHPMKVALESYI